ncbi:MAG: helix-turn-helix domain-containing protein [Planctomyces sp.]|nr:helix-turn-helix domain-containing protein [Planctomyces sp.]
MQRRFSPEHVAKLFGVTKGTVIGWCEDGTMPAVNVARAAATRKRWRMSEEDIEEFQRRRQNGAPLQQAKGASGRRKAQRPAKDFFAEVGGAK